MGKVAGLPVILLLRSAGSVKVLPVGVDTLLHAGLKKGEDDFIWCNEGEGRPLPDPSIAPES